MCRSTAAIMLIILSDVIKDLTGEEHTIKARSVVNAAGCFVDDIMHMDSPTHRKMVTWM